MLLTAVSLITSLGTVAVMWLLSSQRREAWIVSLCNQVGWLTLIYLTQAWGLLLLSAAMVYIAIRGLRRWKPPEPARCLCPDYDPLNPLYYLRGVSQEELERMKRGLAQRAAGERMPLSQMRKELGLE